MSAYFVSLWFVLTINNLLKYLRSPLAILSSISSFGGRKKGTGVYLKEPKRVDRLSLHAVTFSSVEGTRDISGHFVRIARIIQCSVFVQQLLCCLLLQRITGTSPARIMI